MSATFSATRNEPRNCVTIVIELPDSDLARNYLVPVDTSGPVDALAGYVLHCLQVIDRVRSDRFGQWLEAIYQQKRANRRDEG